MIAQLMARLGRWVLESHDNRRLSRQQYDTSDLSVLADIPYVADGTEEHLLDIYRPKNSSDELPVLVNIHGGGLIASYKTVNTWFNHQCARMGYAVVSISYRRLPDTTLIHQIEDVMTALRFIRSNSERFHLNTNSCYLTADSAGALLALYALSINQSEALQQAFRIAPSGLSFRAAAFISIMLDAHSKGLLSFIGKVLTRSEEAEQPYLPYILHPASLIGQAQLPPLYLVTSAEDMLRSDSLRLSHLLTASGLNHTLHDLPKGQQHKLVHVFSVVCPTWPESRQVLSEIDTFFRHRPYRD